LSVTITPEIDVAGMQDIRLRNVLIKRYVRVSHTDTSNSHRTSQAVSGISPPAGPWPAWIYW